VEMAVSEFDAGQQLPERLRIVVLRKQQEKCPLMQLTRCGDRLLIQSVLRQFYRVDFDRIGNLSTAFSVHHLKTVMGLPGFRKQHPTKQAD